MPDTAKPRPYSISDPKNRVKTVFNKLIRELIEAEAAWHYAENPQTHGLKILGRFPLLLRELPTITISTSRLIFSPLQNNRFLVKDQVIDISQGLGDDESLGFVEAYSFTGDISLDVTAGSDDERDRLIDLLFSYFAWENNSAAVNVMEYLAKLGIRMRFDEFPFSGDQEIRLPSEDIAYTDGMSFPIYGEVYSPKVPVEKLEGIDFNLKTPGLELDISAN